MSLSFRFSSLQGGREQAVADRLEGLDFKWSGKTLLPDPLITDFIRQSVENTLSQQQQL